MILDDTPVTLGDLELILSALDNSLNLASALDLQNKFLNLNTRQRDSALARQLQEARSAVEGYIEQATS